MSETQTKYVAIGATIMLCGAFYWLRLRKTVSRSRLLEKFKPSPPVNNLLKTLGLSHAIPEEFNGWEHPEGPTIAAESQSSWLDKDVRPSAKIDLLHRGYTKGKFLILIHPTDFVI